MKIYQDRVEIKKYPNLGTPKKGSFLRRLVGVHFATGKHVVIEPIYQPLIKFENLGGTILIEVSFDKPVLDIWISKRRPFIQIHRPKGFYIEDDN